MYKCVGPSEVISSKQKKKNKKIKLDINLLSKPNKYKTKQTNRKKISKRNKKKQQEYTFYRSDLVLYT